jgi:hypothetical protein
MSLVFEKLIQTLAAGQVLKIGIAGDFFRLAGALWPVTVSLMKGGQIIGTMSNVLAGDYVNGIDFDQIWVTNGATAQAVTLQISGGGAGSDRVIGEVSVIDGGKFRTLNSQAFVHSANVQASAGVNPTSILFNPAGSLKNIFIKAVRSSFSVTQAYGIEFITDKGTNAVADAAAIVPKMIGSVSAATAWKNTTASFNGVSIGLNSFLSAALSANQIDFVTFQEPIIIKPGQGMRAFGTIAATTFIFGAEYVEEDI